MKAEVGQFGPMVWIDFEEYDIPHDKPLKQFYQLCSPWEVMPILKEGNTLGVTDQLLYLPNEPYAADSFNGRHCMVIFCDIDAAAEYYITLAKTIETLGKWSVS